MNVQHTPAACPRYPAQPPPSPTPWIRPPAGQKRALPDSAKMSQGWTPSSKHAPSSKHDKSNSDAPSKSSFERLEAKLRIQQRTSFEAKFRVQRSRPRERRSMGRCCLHSSKMFKNLKMSPAVLVRGLANPRLFYTLETAARGLAELLEDLLGRGSQPPRPPRRIVQASKMER